MKNQIILFFTIIFFMCFGNSMLFSQNDNSNFSNSYNSEPFNLYSSCHPDSLALMALYNATNGDNWTDNSHWGQNCDLSTWHGVTVNENGRVTILTLPNNNLVGELPLEIGQLTELVEIFLDENALSGTIPEALYTIPTLENIILSSNSLIGNLSDNICQLNNLNEIRLSDNQLSGEIPACLGDFTNLLMINLSDNQLSGCYPSSWLTYCGNEQMHFDGNLCLRDFTAFCSSNGDCSEAVTEHPDFAPLMALYNATNGDNWTDNSNWGMNCDISNWHGVTVNENGRVAILTLPNNNLVGELPSEIGQLTELVEIFFDENELSGIIPEDLYTIPTLENIILSDNSLTGNLSDNICQLDNLNEIRLSDNQLSGEIPACLGDFTNLLIINLSNNQFSGCYPNSWLTYCGNEQMHFDDNPCLLDFTAFCSSNGDCSEALAEHPDFTPLMALYNATNGDSWANNSNWGMDCNVCNWYGVTCENNRVTQLRLDDNQLMGSLPTELSNLANLRTLFLSTNQLSGSIPAELGNLANLEVLFLFNNQLSGSIPAELGNLSNLQNLYLPFNQLSGSIPIELGNLSNLQYLTLNTNQLSGSIPTELGNLSELQSLSLSENQLSGSIPASLGNLANLEFLHLFTNQLTGCIPNELSNLCNENFNVNISSNPNLDEQDFATFCSTNSGACEVTSECPAHVSVTTDLSTDIVMKAAQTITSDKEINSPANVVFKAGQFITLLSGFHAKAGATFSAKIEDCVVENTLDNTPELAKTVTTSNPNTANNSLTDATLSANDVHIFPNPTTAAVTIELTKSITGQITLYNSFGQELTLLSIDQYSTRLDLSAYPTGVYWIALVDMERKERLVKKVVRN